MSNLDLKPGSRHRHYKGREYVVVGYARREADGAPLVLYTSAHALPGAMPWARPAHEWDEIVTLPDGPAVKATRVLRFAEVK